MKWIPIPDNEPKTINLALEEIYSLLSKQTAQVEQIASHPALQKETAVEVAAEEEAVGVSPSVAGFTPIVSAISGTTSMVIDWSSWAGYGSPDVVDYDIYVSTEVDCTISADNLKASHVVSSPYTLTNLAPAVTYSVKVVANGKAGTGAATVNVSVTTSSPGTSILQSGTDPTEIGDMKLVSGTNIVLQSCDSKTAWSVVSGVIAFGIDTSILQEGSASVKIGMLNTGVHVAKATFGAVDLSAADYIKLWLRRQYYVTPTMTLYFGEAAYNEQSTVVTLDAADTWYYLSWDISGIAAGSRNAVTLFGIGITTITGSQRFVWVDDIRAVGAEALRIMFSDGLHTVTVV